MTPTFPIEFPILMEGIPEGGYTQSERARVELRFGGRAVTYPASVQRRGGGMYEMFVPSEEDLQRMREPFSMRTTATLNYHGDPRRVELERSGDAGSGGWAMRQQFADGAA